jgi:hypothetical protein
VGWAVVHSVEDEEFRWKDGRSCAVGALGPKLSLASPPKQVPRRTWTRMDILALEFRPLMSGPQGANVAGELWAAVVCIPWKPMTDSIRGKR